MMLPNNVIFNHPSLELCFHFIMFVKPSRESTHCNHLRCFFMFQVLNFNNNYSGVILLVGQIADGLSTTLVGGLSDRPDTFILCRWDSIGLIRDAVSRLIDAQDVSLWIGKLSNSLLFHPSRKTLWTTKWDYFSFIFYCHNPSPSPKSESKVQSQKSKVWGLGVTLFCCCTTHHPPTKTFLSNQTSN